MAAGAAGVVREAARFENSAWVLACWSLTLSATGPREMSTMPFFSMNNNIVLPLVTLWVTGWFATALTAAEASKKAVSVV